MEINKRKSKKGWVAEHKIYKNIFIKYFDHIQDFELEVNNYDKYNKFLKTPKRKKVFYKSKKIYYEMIKDLNKKTIHSIIDKSMYVSLNQIYKIIALKRINECSTNNYKLFYDRCSLLELYQDSLHLPDNVTINKKPYIHKLDELLITTRNKIRKSKILYCSISQGDPIDLNILIDGTIIDFECIGYNSLVSQLAIMIANLYLGGYYYLIKYASSSYLPYKDKLKDLNKRVHINYRTFSNKISINYSLDVPKEYKYFIKTIFEFFDHLSNDEIKNEIGNYFKYYFIFRFLTPKNILEFSKKDRFLILAIVLESYQKFNNYTEISNYFKNL